jgi:hypothetical protein
MGHVRTRPGRQRAGEAAHVGAVIKDTIEKAQQEAETLAAKLVGGERFSQISPTGASNENRSGGESAS